MKKISFAFILLMLLGVADCHAQEIYVKAGVSGMLPVRRTFASAEVGKKIMPEYSIGMMCEVSPTESNVSPVIAYTYKRLSVDAGMGWGHRWQHEGCDDHNYHTYTIGAYLSRPVKKHCSLYFGCSALWRSYQAHIGLHKGAVKVSVGMEFDFAGRNNSKRE